LLDAGDGGRTGVNRAFPSDVERRSDEAGDAALVDPLVRVNRMCT
jgi:hypothetical protein